MTASPKYGENLVGSRADVVPGQSAFGSLARIARLNHFSHGELYGVLGLRLRRSDSLLRVLSRSEHQQAKLAAALDRTVEEAWQPSTWHPFTGGPAELGVETLRYCLACMRTGYHPHLHQLPWIGRCPWHAIRLRTGCPRCGGAIAVSGDAQRPLLTCSCGFDLLDERAAARTNASPKGAGRAIDQYLVWARRSKPCNVLVGAPDVPLSAAVLAALVKLPPGLAAAVGAGPVEPAEGALAHARTYRAPRGAVVPNHSVLEGLSADCPQMVELPELIARNVQAVAREMAAKLPQGSLTGRELLLFLGCSVADLANFETAERPSSGTVRSLPPMAVGARHFLDLYSIHPVVVRVLASLGSAEDRCPASGQTSALVRRLQRDFLCRGYAEGLRTVLSRYVPALHDLGRDRPHLTAGWALVGTSEPFEARVAFTRIDAREGAADVLAAARGRH